MRLVRRVFDEEVDLRRWRVCVCCVDLEVLVELVSLLSVVVVLSFIAIGSGVEGGDEGDGGCVRVGMQA